MTDDEWKNTFSKETALDTNWESIGIPGVMVLSYIRSQNAYEPYPDGSTPLADTFPQFASSLHMTPFADGFLNVFKPIHRTKQERFEEAFLMWYADKKRLVHSKIVTRDAPLTKEIIRMWLRKIDIPCPAEILDLESYRGIRALKIVDQGVKDFPT